MKRIVLGVVVAWSGIVALAWWLADQRIERCGYAGPCDPADTATRDGILIGGLIVPLGVVVLLLIMGRLGPKSRS